MNIPFSKESFFIRLTRSKITILIGADHPAIIEILEYRKDPLKPRAPRGLRTHFGWCIAGPTSSHACQPGLSCNRTYLKEIDEDNGLLKRFRQFIGLETYGDDPKRAQPTPPDVSRAIEIMKSTIKHIDGHYEVGVPFKEDDLNLPENYREVLLQFLYLKKRLLRNPSLGERYVKGWKKASR